MGLMRHQNCSAKVIFGRENRANCSERRGDLTATTGHRSCLARLVCLRRRRRRPTRAKEGQSSSANCVSLAVSWPLSTWALLSSIRSEKVPREQQAQRLPPPPPRETRPAPSRRREVFSALSALAAFRTIFTTKNHLRRAILVPHQPHQRPQTTIFDYYLIFIHPTLCVPTHPRD